jgi:hypothetical protein
MKMKKILLTLSILSICLCSNAQNKKNVFEVDITPFSSSLEKGSIVGWRVGLGWQHNYSEYFAWDILHLQVGNSYKFNAKYTSIALFTGPKVIIPVSDETRPFFTLLAGYEGAAKTIADGGGGFGISPEIGVTLLQKFNLSIGYLYSWSSNTVNGTTTEKYVIGSHQVYLSSQKKYVTIYDYGTRTVNTSTTTDNSGGSLYIRLGYYF